jgi:brefeldin A-resistance guanine nucleotide exchange factor 1
VVPIINLYQAVYPSHYSGGLDARQRNVQYLCLDLLLAFVNDMAARAEGVCTLLFFEIIKY